MKTDFNDFVEIFTSLTCKKLWCLSHASPVMKIHRKQQMTFQVRGKPMRRITCRVGDVPRTCCETQSSPEFSPRSLPVLPFSWVAPGDAVATMELRLCSGSPGRTLSPSMVDHSRIPWFFTWETWAITWVSPDHLGFT